MWPAGYVTEPRTEGVRSIEEDMGAGRGPGEHCRAALAALAARPARASEIHTTRIFAFVKEIVYFVL